MFQVAVVMLPPVLIFLTPTGTEPRGPVWTRNHQSDGLSVAYSRPNGLHRDGFVLYFADTRSFGDIVDDMRIPLNDTVHSQRYRDAVPMMRGVDVVVAHSLGGAVALSLSERHDVHPVTYGAPVLDLNPFDPSGSHRHRRVGDPVAFLDLAAQTSLPASFNPHSFE